MSKFFKFTISVVASTGVRTGDTGEDGGAAGDTGEDGGAAGAAGVAGAAGDTG